MFNVPGDRSKLINVLVPGLISSKAIQENFDALRGHFRMLENFTLVLQAARQLNCRHINMSPMDLVKGNVPAPMDGGTILHLI